MATEMHRYVETTKQADALAEAHATCGTYTNANIGNADFANWEKHAISSTMTEHQPPITVTHFKYHTTQPHTHLHNHPINKTFDHNHRQNIHDLARKVKIDAAEKEKDEKD